MEFPNRLAVLLDGEWVKKTLYKIQGASPNPDDIVSLVEQITKTPALKDTHIYRIFYYTAYPLNIKVKHPLQRWVQMT